MSAPEPPQAGTTASRLASRERAAVWIRDHLDAVYRYARRRLDPADAEDVAQQAFLALVKAEAAGRSPEDPAAYLVGTARRRIADLYRRRGRTPPVVPLPGGWDAFADRPLPDEALAAAETRELVHVVLGLLPGVDREALLAVHRDGVPVAEVARRLACSEKAVEMRLYRARAAFRARLLEVGRDWTDAPDAGSGPGEAT